MQSKTTMNYYLKAIRMAIIKKIKDCSVGKVIRRMNP